MLLPPQAQDLTQKLVEQAVRAGATAADAMYAGNLSSSVDVRLGELEGVSRSETEQVGLRLFVGHRSASVASSDLSAESLGVLVERALAMAEQAPEDPFAGLASPELLASAPFPDVDSFDADEPDPADLRHRAMSAERAALGVPGVTNSSGSGASASATIVGLSTSSGFTGGYRASGYGCSATVIAGEGTSMQRDYASHSARYLEDLEQAEFIGRTAGERAAARVNPVRPTGGKYPVLFDPRVSSSLLGHFAGAISGSSVARKTSFLQEKLGERIFGAGVTIIDDPLRLRGLRSRPFDGEGVGVSPTELVSKGILKQWIADSAAARQLGIAPTGHAARSVGSPPGAAPSNLYMAAGKRGRAELLAACPEAVLVIELIGQGVNGVTGDYSRGAVGFMVRDGEIAEPVAEITIASNLIDMFATLEPGSDLEFRRGIDAPTILIPEMTVASG